MDHDYDSEVGKTFTVSLTVKSEDAESQLLTAMAKEELVCGCIINRIDTDDSAIRYAEKLERLRDTLSNLIEEF